MSLPKKQTIWGAGLSGPDSLRKRTAKENVHKRSFPESELQEKCCWTISGHVLDSCVGCCSGKIVKDVLPRIGLCSAGWCKRVRAKHNLPVITVLLFASGRGASTFQGCKSPQTKSAEAETVRFLLVDRLLLLELLPQFAHASDRSFPCGSTPVRTSS